METAELTIIDRSLDVLKDGGRVLNINKSRSEKAIAVGNKILAAIDENGGKLTPELDERCMKYLANCNNSKAEMNEARKPITQVFTMISKEFTAAENALDVKTDGMPPLKIQNYRNQYAKQCHEEELERQRKAKEEADRQQEIINLRAECEKRMIKYVGDYTAERKLALNTRFNQITLDTYDERVIWFKDLLPSYPYEHFKKFEHNLASRLLKSEELSAALKLTIEGKYNELSDSYAIELQETRDFLIDRLPSKLQELQAIRAQEIEEQEARAEQERIKAEQATANEARQKELLKEQQAAEEKQRLAAEEKKRLDDERIERERQEAARAEEDAAKVQEMQMQAVENNKEVESTLNMFSAETAISESSAATPETRQGYDIEVLNSAGWMQIFQLWFTEEGKNLSNAKVGAVKMDTMKSYCEKIAHKNGTKIDSKFLSYSPSYKAVNRKVA